MSVAVFAAGYIIGARAGREHLVEKASQRLKKTVTQRLAAYIARHPPAAPGG
jgi:membrane protein DedA with SNARE-associated domain